MFRRTTTIMSKNLAFNTVIPVTIPIVGQADTLFPVRRVYCVGQNYASHAKEMGNTDTKVEPFFFAKPTDAVVMSPTKAPFPPMCEEWHHEIELVVALGKDAFKIDEAAAAEHIFGYAVGLDMTRRDLQKAAKAKGRPWDLAKGSDFSAPCSHIVPRADVDSSSSFLNKGEIKLEINGKQVQHGCLSDMILPIDKLISLLSHYVELKAGDLIYTGTPEGVGPVRPGDHLVGSVAGVAAVEMFVEEPRK